MGIVDSQSVPNASSAEESGYDAGKKVSGIKRHITVDTLGLPHALHVTTANISDRDGAIEMLTMSLDDLSRVKKLIVDAGYSGDAFSKSVKEVLGNHVEVEVVKRNELSKFVVLPKRWIVERTFGWLDNSRRLWKNCEKTLWGALNMLTFALLAVLIKRF
jgi:transposase